MAGHSSTPGGTVLIGFIVIAVALSLTLVGDRFTFVRKPANAVQKCIVIPTVLAYKATHDRVSSNVFGFVIWGGIFGFTIGGGAWVVNEFVLKPFHIRRSVWESKREEKLRNVFLWKYDELQEEKRRKSH